jgi:hypothetical protein
MAANTVPRAKLHALYKASTNLCRVGAARQPRLGHWLPAELAFTDVDDAWGGQMWAECVSGHRIRTTETVPALFCRAWS